MPAMKKCLMLLAPLALLAGAGPLRAQGYPYPAYQGQRPVQWDIHGGASITEGEAGRDFNNGGTFGTGVTFHPQPGPFALRLEVNYARSSATDQFVTANENATNTPIDDGSMQTVTGFLDGVLAAPFGPWARFYASAGAGLGWRRIELTQNGFRCDVFFCGSGFGRDVLIASQDDTRFAWNAGAGVDFLLPNGSSWFIEARYERIETQQPTELIPIRFGFRF